MALLSQGVVEDRHYDYAQLIFSALVEMVTVTKRKKSMKYLPYVRFFSKIIFSAMSHNQEISRRINHLIAELFHMSFVRYSTEEFDFERPLIPALLNYADQQALSVRPYRELHALMVQPEPEGPAHSEPHSGEGIGSRDSEPGVQGQGEQRENVNEKGSGVGGASVDQRAETSSILNVAEHIGQISSEVQMETLFESAE